MVGPINAVYAFLGYAAPVCGVDCGISGVEVVDWGEEGGGCGVGTTDWVQSVDGRVHAWKCMGVGKGEWWCGLLMKRPPDVDIVGKCRERLGIDISVEVSKRRYDGIRYGLILVAELDCDTSPSTLLLLLISSLTIPH